MSPPQFQYVSFLSNKNCFRAQKPIAFTAMGFTDISLVTYSSVRLWANTD